MKQEEQKSVEADRTTATGASDRLRYEIDSGQTGEKVGVMDPAAAPLGTDAEAGGQATTEFDAPGPVPRGPAQQPTSPFEDDSRTVTYRKLFVILAVAAAVLVLAMVFLGLLG
jgi:hypothetical protein